MRPIYEIEYGCPENFLDSLTLPTATFPPNSSWAIVPIDPMNMRKNFKSVNYTYVPAIGVPKNVGIPWLCTHSLFPKNFIGLPYRLFLYVHTLSYNFRSEFGLRNTNLQSRERGHSLIGDRGSGIVPSVGEFL